MSFTFIIILKMMNDLRKNSGQGVFETVKKVKILNMKK